MNKKADLVSIYVLKETERRDTTTWILNIYI